MKQILPYGKYNLLERVSVGGMAEVFRAQLADEPSGPANKIIAIKRILPSMAEDADFIQMFIDEARISGQLHHPHIAEIYELGCVGESHFIAMEFVWGKDVLQIQNRFRRLKQVMPPPMAAYCAMKIAEALDYAHKKKGPDGVTLGIIHRDVSPQNVLVSYEGIVKVIDFGIAKAASRSTKTQAGVLKGKFGYMSPEQIGGIPLDRRSDIFAIGTIFYELLTADRLFAAESDFATLEKVRNVDVQPPRVTVPGCPDAVDAIIMRALSKDPATRYQWASEMAEEIQAYLSSLPEKFGPRELSAWMQEQFAAEVKRESQALDDQLKAVGELGKAQASAPLTTSLPLSAPVPPVSGTMELDVSDLQALLAGEPQPSAISGEATQITSASLSQMMAGGASPEAALSFATAAAGGHAEMSVESTRILGADEPRPGDPISSAPMTAAAGGFSMPAHAEPEEIPSQATTILDTSSMNLPPLRIAPTPQFRAQPQRTAQPIDPRYTPAFGTPQFRLANGQLDPNPPTTQVDALAYAEPRRSTFGKDVLIGLGVAGLLVVGVVGGRTLFAKGKAQGGTLVVTVTPPAASHVTIDGQDRGRLEAGKALTLKEFPAGSHLVHVTSEGGGEFEERVVLGASDVSVVSAVLSAAPPPIEKTAKKEESPAPVVPAPEVAAPQAEKPAPVAPPLAPQQPVAAPEKPAVPVAVASPRPTVAVESPRPAAEKPAAPEAPAAEKQAPPAAGKAHLVVKTDPPGAEVNVNGKTIGLTPVDTSDFESGKSVRVSIRKKGFATVAKYLDFEKEPERTIDVKLAGAGGAAAPEEAKGEEPKAAEKTPEKIAEKAAPAKPVAARPGAAEPGFLVANTQPWAKVIIDGKDTGKSTPIAPRSKISLKPGKHVVTFVVDAGKKFSFDVEIKSGEDFKLIKTLGE